MALLQAAASILAFAQGPKATLATMQSAVNIGSNSVQIAAQAMAPINFPVPENTGVAPNITELIYAPYQNTAGKYVQLSPSFQLVEEDTSFGDLNHDGLDDAAVIINEPTTNGNQYFLGAVLNQGGILFNIANLPLGNSITITSHAITNGIIILNGTERYQLLGDALIKA